MRRRELIAAAALTGFGAVRAAEPADRATLTPERRRELAASRPALGGPASPDAERSALLARGERRLASGDVEAAVNEFELAAQRAHTADTEMSLVRAWMQQGEYRRAIAFVAHTAQAHRQTIDAVVLYAWLLSRAAQDVQALRMLDGADTSDADGGCVLVARVRELIRPSDAVPDADLLAPPLRLAPYATGAVTPRSARVVGAAVLLDDGRHALTSQAALRGARDLWLRNGLGQTVRIQAIASRSRDGDVALVELVKALPTGGTAVAPRDPFPGSPGSVLVHRADSMGRAAWPRLYAGFQGAPADGSEPGYRHLGIDVPAFSNGPKALHGGPVFDAAGRWAGIAVPHADGGPRCVMRSMLVTDWPQMIASAALKSSVPSGPAAHAPLDQVYEGALLTGLQLVTRT